MKWNAAQERKYLRAQQEVAELTAARGQALTDVAETFGRAGIVVTAPFAPFGTPGTPVENIVKMADAIRDALAPFDSGERHDTRAADPAKEKPVGPPNVRVPMPWAPGGAL